MAQGQVERSFGGEVPGNAREKGGRKQRKKGGDSVEDLVRESHIGQKKQKGGGGTARKRGGTGGTQGVCTTKGENPSEGERMIDKMVVLKACSKKTEGGGGGGKSKKVRTRKDIGESEEIEEKGEQAAGGGRR